MTSNNMQIIIAALILTLYIFVISPLTILILNYMEF